MTAVQIEVRCHLSEVLFAYPRCLIMKTVAFVLLALSLLSFVKWLRSFNCFYSDCCWDYKYHRHWKHLFPENHKPLFSKSGQLPWTKHPAILNHFHLGSGHMETLKTECSPALWSNCQSHLTVMSFVLFHTPKEHLSGPLSGPAHRISGNPIGTSPHSSATTGNRQLPGTEWETLSVLLWTSGSGSCTDVWLTVQNDQRISSLSSSNLKCKQIDAQIQKNRKT